jgi:hypothetical protein
MYQALRLCSFSLFAPRWKESHWRRCLLGLRYCHWVSRFFSEHWSLLWEVLKLADAGTYTRYSALDRKVRDSDLNGLAPEHHPPSVRRTSWGLRDTGYGRQARYLFLALATRSAHIGASVIHRALRRANGIGGLRLRVPGAFFFAPASSRDWAGLDSAVGLRRAATGSRALR